MKKKIAFGLQVFTTLVLFTAIFISYIERKDVQSANAIDRGETISNSIGGTNRLIDMIKSTFTASLPEVIFLRQVNTDL
jgi:hypothetical protein